MSAQYKFATYLFIFGLVVFAIGIYLDFEQLYSGYPIEVRYEDGQPPVDKTYADPTYTIVKVTCPNVVAIIEVVTYEGQKVTESDKKELTNIICDLPEEIK